MNSQNPPLPRYLLPLWLVISLLLISCSGGGSSSAPPTGATLEVKFTKTKTFSFSWTATPNTDYYLLLENKDGSSGFTTIASRIPSNITNYDHAVSLFKRINARYLLKSCDASGKCIDSNEAPINDILADSIGYFKASNPDADDNFGISVALSADGDTLAVGAHKEDSNAKGVNSTQTNNSASNAGAVYVFSRNSTNNNTSWEQQAYIKASNPDADDNFGISVALSTDGNTLAVGAWHEGSNRTGVNSTQTDNSAAKASGAVYVFTRSSTTSSWTQQAYIKASNTDTEDSFGASIALSANGNTLAVGALFEDNNSTGVNSTQTNNSASNAGAVYVFTRSSTGSWTQQAYIKASNTDADDRFNVVSLSADGNTLAVGSSWENSSATGINGNQINNSAYNAGAVYVFTRSSTGSWTQQAYIKASNTDAGDNFGISVALSTDGNTLAVGSLAEGSSATRIDGAGAVYIFIRSNSSWTQQAYIKASNADAGDNFGVKVALSADGALVAVGAIGEDSNSKGVGTAQTNNSAYNAGAVYVFTRSSSSWTQQAYIKASNTGTKDSFGASIAISAKSNTLAVGAYWEDSSAKSINGDQINNGARNAGAVYLY